nr:MAG TPA: hypothetical protein [Caudoviricetes sp.]
MSILGSMAVASTDLALRAGGDHSVLTVGKILERGYSTVTVSILGGAPVQVPAASGDWKTVQAAHILVNPLTGRPVYALAPASATYPDTLEPPAELPTTATYQQVLITPDWANTYSSRGWSADSACPCIWQGKNDLHPQQATGYIDYGQKIQALGQIAVTSATLRITSRHLAPWTINLQAATATRTTPPSPTGATITATIPPVGTTHIDITTLAPQLLDGHGLALTGTDYGEASARGESLTLLLDYELTY